MRPSSGIQIHAKLTSSYGFVNLPLGKNRVQIFSLFFLPPHPSDRQFRYLRHPLAADNPVTISCFIFHSRCVAHWGRTWLAGGHNLTNIITP